MEQEVTPFTSSLRVAKENVKRIATLEISYQRLDSIRKDLGEFYSSADEVLKVTDKLLDLILRAQ